MDSRPSVDAPREPLEAATQRGWRRGLRQTALAVAALVLLALAVRFVGTAGVVEALGDLPRGALLLAVALYAVAWALRVARVAVITDIVGGTGSVVAATSLATGANAINLVAPARAGDVAAFLWLRRSTGGTAAVAAMMTWRLGDAAAVVLLAAVAGGLHALMGASPGNVWPWAILGTGAAAVAVGLVASGAARSRPAAWVKDTAARRLLGRHAASVHLLGSHLERLLRPDRAVAVLVLAVLAWLVEVAVVATLLQAILSQWTNGVSFSHAAGLALLPTALANLAKMVPSTPGGIGVFEGVLAAGLASQGVAGPAALATAIAAHLMMNVFTLAVGVPGALMLARDPAKASK